MSLTFPNSSRSYDARNGRVRFIGHDGMFQISFSVATDALSRKNATQPNTEDEFLAAFDAARARIQDVASKAYAKTRKSSYALTSADI